MRPFEPTFIVERLDASSLRILLRALYRLNMQYLRRHPETPSLYESGVRYEVERSGERWQGIPAVIGRGFGDCEDLTAWRLAELAQAGELGRPAVKKRLTPHGWLWHVWVIRANGTEEDPSRRLGMK